MMLADSSSPASCVQPASSSPPGPTAAPTEPTVAATSVSASTSFSDNGELFNIAPPPECIFPSLQLAEESLHRWTKANGFNLSRRSAAYTKDKRAHTVYYECDRAGRPKNTGRLIESERVRTMRGSKRSGCPMKLKLCAVDKRNLSGEWSIVHHKSGSNMHNHKPSRDIRVHAAHRRRSCIETTQAPVESMHSWVSAQSSAGISTSSIHASILATSDSSLVTPKDISNARDAARRRDVATRTPMEALFQDLQKHNFYYRHVINPASNQLQKMGGCWPEIQSIRYRLD